MPVFSHYFWKYKADEVRRSVHLIETSENPFFWCRVSKASSASWLKLFAIEKGILDESKREKR